MNGGEPVLQREMQLPWKTPFHLRTERLIEPARKQWAGYLTPPP